MTSNKCVSSLCLGWNFKFNYMYRPTSLSRNQGELRNHFEFSEVRDKQIVTRHENCHVRSMLLIESTFQQHILEHDCSNAVSFKFVLK